MVEGTLSILSSIYHLPIDSDASHSFILEEFVDSLSIPILVMLSELLVEAPSEEIVLVFMYLGEVIVEIEGCQIPLNLQVLELQTTM